MLFDTKTFTIRTIVLCKQESLSCGVVSWSLISEAKQI